jgi:hypothetical protein
MGSYTLEEVVRRWSRGKLTTEQVIGQLLLIVQSLAQRVGRLEREVENQRNGESTLTKDTGGSNT